LALALICLVCLALASRVLALASKPVLDYIPDSRHTQVSQFMLLSSADCS
jgi:hypothetical protein